MASPNSQQSLIAPIRTASRLMIRELGFMSSTSAGTDYSPSAVHALIELGSSSTPLTASALSQMLNLDKSSVSRMVKKLVLADEIGEGWSEGDTRVKSLTLTPKGKETLAWIEKFGNDQVSGALERISDGTSPQVILEGINAYASALRARRLGAPEILAKKKEEEIKVVSGYRPGIVASCLDMQMRYYAPNHGFGAVFEALLATQMGELVPRLSNPKNEVFAAVDGRGEIAGVVWIDGELGMGKAHLRFFIVDMKMAGKGVGGMLMDAAMKFVDGNEIEECHLWTFRGLHAARKLYDKAGFVLVDEGFKTPWGSEVWVQHFVRKRDGKKDEELSESGLSTIKKESTAS